MIPINELSRGFRIYQKEYEEKALEVLRSGWYILGKEVDALENEFAASLNPSCYCATVDNGLDSIMLGLQAAGITSGDEIILQANGYIATALAIIHCGAVPIFIEPDAYYQLDYRNIEKAISPKTKAVLVTHLYGLSTQMTPIIEVCKKNNLMLFEDCAQSHFSSYKGTYTGLFGEASFFSFYPTKTLGCFGDGGCVVSKNPKIIEKVKVLRNYGSDYRNHNIKIGYNARLDELQAGLLRIKLKHIKTLLSNRNYIAQRYLNEITNPLVKLPQIPKDCVHTWYQFVVEVNNQEKFRKYLLEKGIATDILWKVPPYLQPAMVDKFGYKAGMFPLTETICNHIVSLPMMDYIEEFEIEKVIKEVNEYEE